MKIQLQEVPEDLKAYFIKKEQRCGACYICHTVEWAREVHRVLRDDAVFFLNLGDSYNGSGGAGGDYNKGGLKEGQPRYPGTNDAALKPKDLMGVPWRVALALQADGWWLRSDIIWAKTNPMPESVTDRPTKSHEYLFLLTKNKSYYYDQDAIREGANPDTSIRDRDNTKLNNTPGRTKMGGLKTNHYSNRNRRTVWTIATKPYSGAHFATYPPALIEPCIKAGTSEKGVCPECGAQWERVTNPQIDHAKRIKNYRVMNFDGDKIGAYIQAGLNKKEWSQSRLAEYFPSATGGKTGCVHNWVTGKNIPTPEQWKIIKQQLELGRKFDLLLENPALDEIEGWPEQDMLNKGMNDAGAHIPTGKITVGWQPGCDHGLEPVPAKVFDPFIGSGTTVQVARNLGRTGIGTDLSLEYLDLARERLSLDILDDWEHGQGKDGETDLEGLPMFTNQPTDI